MLWPLLRESRPKRRASANPPRSCDNAARPPGACSGGERGSPRPLLSEKHERIRSRAAKGGKSRGLDDLDGRTPLFGGRTRPALAALSVPDLSKPDRLELEFGLRKAGAAVPALGQVVRNQGVDVTAGRKAAIPPGSPKLLERPLEQIGGPG